MDAPLYRCLRLFAEYKNWHDVIFSSAPGGEITPGHGVIEAEKAGLNAELLAYNKLKKIPSGILPCILVMQHNHFCILTKINGKNAHVILPETGGENVLLLSDLQKDFAGEVLVLSKPKKLDKTEKHWLWHNVQRFRPLYGHVLLASLLLNLFAVALPLYIMNVYDRVIPNQAWSTLIALSFGIVVLFGFEFLMRNLRAYFTDLVGRNIDVLASGRLFDKALSIRLEHAPASTGGLINNIREFDQVRDFFTSSTLTTFIDVPFILIFILIISFIAGPIAIIPLAAIPIIFLASYIFQRPLNKAVAEGRESGQHKQSILYETMSRLETVKAMNGGSSMRGAWEEAVAESGASGRKAKMAGSLAMTFTQLATQLVTILIIIFGVIRIGNGDMTVGALIATTILTGRAMAPLASIASMLTRLQQMWQSLDALNQMMALPAESTGTVFNHCEGGFKVDNVSFAYPEQPPVLQDISFQLQPGEKVALLGRVGSGKSTLARLLCGLSLPTKGHILLDGKDLRQLNPSDLREHVAFAPQEPALFQGSIYDNIALGLPPFQHDYVEEAVKTARVNQFTDRMPQGLQSPVLEMGKNFSGGQRQSIHLARALARNAQVLILDEPTAQYDNQAEAEVRTALQQSLKDKTLILITHRSSLLPLVDRIIVLEQGRIILDGARNDVLKKLSGQSNH